MTQNTVLLVMDVQVNILELVPESKSLVVHTNEAIAAAHEANIPVVYVVFGTRKDYIGFSENNKFFSMLKSLPFSLEKPEVHPLIIKRADDVVVTKRRAGAFSGSDLLCILRALKAEKLVLCGIETGGVVLTTATEAADMDYELTVLSDCCADLQPEVHTFLVSKVLPKYASVIETKDWIGSIKTK